MDKRAAIRVRGARQHNLKNLDLELPLNELIVITGVSGSGKSSLAFDTLYAEGQRRYVETFSPYARQFLDRMDKPQVDSIEGIPPAIAIDQVNPVRSSRSTVGTMTELADHLKLLYARCAQLYCRGCGREVRRDNVASISAAVQQRAAATPAARLSIGFSIAVPDNFEAAEVRTLLEQQGYTRIQTAAGGRLEVIQDRLRAAPIETVRLAEALEAALRVGNGRLQVTREIDGAAPEIWRFSTALHCAECDVEYRDLTPSAFSFNSPLGACDTCRGFGRSIGIDYGLVVPDETKSLAGGAVKPFQSDSYRECQDDLLRFAERRGVPTDRPWRELSEAQRTWVIDGEGGWEKKVWYGAKRFFAWLETKAYKMHIRVLLSKYRAYTECRDCGGARLKAEALNWRAGSAAAARAALGTSGVFRPRGVTWQLPPPGLSLHDFMLLPIERARAFADALELPAAIDEAAEMLLRELRSRLRYLCDVGLGYLTLDRQSRTLSGGEVQRINLTTALGTSLTNALFVLDEPSIGLHARDLGRVVEVMRRLRSAGNSLLVVEHDRQVMAAADRILDLGPGPGERGGAVVFFDRPAALLDAKTGLTADYFCGRKEVAASHGQQATPSAWLTVRGAAQHNLKHIDVAIPLQRLVCLTGVSGSGKSTLVGEVLYRALLKRLGRPTELPGRHAGLEGAEWVQEVVLVDQSPIGKTTRSNPASYVGAFDAIRKRFAAAPLALERGYSARDFSFNAGDGRCPQCGGNGFEHVEMQFLSDVYLRCPECDGRRYRAELLEVNLPGAAGHAPRNIAEVLDLTVREALEFCADFADLRRALQPLVDVGLDYLRLGQPVPTLSGGESQRLKLAGHLVAAAGSQTKRCLFLFDEPTTGLHFDDVAKLLRALRQLTAAGQSVLVIEHNLELARAADWIIDLGPEGGEAGGEVVCSGRPDEVAQHPRSHTAAALRDMGKDASVAEPAATYCSDVIAIHQAREHNLHGVDVEIPRGEFCVITGVSGSGKSTLAFDILFAEGQRRYLESLNAYARQFVQPAARPDVDAITGIPPTVAIEQRTSRGGQKSTVATQTEIYHYLRLLFVKLGVAHCPDCKIAIEPQSREAIAARIQRDYRGQRIGLLAPLVVARKGYYTDLAKWAARKGATHLRVDGEFLPVRPWPRLERFREHDIDLPVRDLVVTPETESTLREALDAALEFGRGLARVLPLEPLAAAWGKAAANVAARALPVQSFSTKRACPRCQRSFPEPDPRLFSFNSRHGWCPACYGTGRKLAGFDAEQSGEEGWWNEADHDSAPPCAQCQGERLNPLARAVRFQGEGIAQLTARSVAQASAYFAALQLSGREAEIARDVLAELRSRLVFVDRVGLGYLSLDRAAPTLSGGEAQRIRLAAQLGSNLRGVCYILDEPTIGLHPRDNRILLDTLEALQHKGNTLVVVEHDEDTIRRASHVIDLGPGAGAAGGRVVAAGNHAALTATAASITGRYLRQPLRHPSRARRGSSTTRLTLRAARRHNLDGVDAAFPLRRMVVVSGVSGSGKSSLARDLILAELTAALAARRLAQTYAPRFCAELTGVEDIDRVLEVDQTPIGKTPRSCPATYVGFWDAIRRLFADTAEARVRGYGAARFSFNTPGGRCPSCEGQGMRRVEMSFLPDVKVACDECGGQRFNPETLAVTYRGKTIGEVLAMPVDEAVEFFAHHRGVHHALQLLQQVGLGYLGLGQQSPTLSGGEAQRIKLVTELAKVGAELPRRRPAHTFYVLDEPTVGLHMADVEKLIAVLHRLVDAGNSVLIVEHNLDIIAEADWVIDLGPEGGSGGGRIVAAGSPEHVSTVSGSHTGAVLREFLRDRAA
jgi:excinuclease ABC subunit A